MARVVVLGAGPAGLAAALELAEAGVQVTLLEQQGYVGGNAASFEMGGIHVDFGSHRLHPASDPQVLARIRKLLGDDLLTRPRHGRIRLMGRWIHFPLRSVDLLLKAHPRFSVGVALDLIKKLLPWKLGPATEVEENFAAVLNQGLGDTICQEFYFPYAKKVWGLAPEELSPIQARKRVSAGSIGKMLRRLLPGGTGSGGANTKGIFYYPRYGFGQISQSLYQACVAAGVDVRLNTRITQIGLLQSERYVETESAGCSERFVTDQVFSTIPMTVLALLLKEPVPDDVKKALSALEFRSMVLVYLQLAQNQFTEFDAHYFPGLDLPFTRISETRNYSDRTEPEGRTVLCVEIPCFTTDALWEMSESELGVVVCEGLGKAGLPITSEVMDVQVKRVPYAYPLYKTGYDQHFGILDGWLSGKDGLLSFGRQGLYAHDNTHHAMYMAKTAADCLDADGTIDEQAWSASRKIFESHVVED